MSSGIAKFITQSHMLAKILNEANRGHYTFNKCMTVSTLKQL